MERRTGLYIFIYPFPRRTAAGSRPEEMCIRDSIQACHSGNRSCCICTSVRKPGGQDQDRHQNRRISVQSIISNGMLFYYLAYKTCLLYTSRNWKRRAGKMIDGKTRICGLFGNPVEHTLSPVIHNTLAKRCGINTVSYTHLDVYKRQG